MKPVILNTICIISSNTGILNRLFHCKKSIILSAKREDDNASVRLSHRMRIIFDVLGFLILRENDRITTFKKKKKKKQQRPSRCCKKRVSQSERKRRVAVISSTCNGKRGNSRENRHPAGNLYVENSSK